MRQFLQKKNYLIFLLWGLPQSHRQAQAIASLKFSIIYRGIGFNSGSATENMSGTFEEKCTDDLTGQTITKTLEIPSTLDFESSGFTTTLGGRLSLGFFKIFGSYTLQE
jgi:hypothetical protein